MHKHTAACDVLSLALLRAAGARAARVAVHPRVSAMTEREGGNRSGLNVSPVSRIPSTEAERRVWQWCARRSGETLAAWMRRAANKQALKENGRTPEEKMDP